MQITLLYVEISIALLVSFLFTWHKVWLLGMKEWKLREYLYWIGL